jgi:hypothetical protein
MLENCPRAFRPNVRALRRDGGEIYRLGPNLAWDLADFLWPRVRAIRLPIFQILDNDRKGHSIMLTGYRQICSSTFTEKVS